MKTKQNKKAGGHGVGRGYHLIPPGQEQNRGAGGSRLFPNELSTVQWSDKSTTNKTAWFAKAAMETGKVQ